MQILDSVFEISSAFRLAGLQVWSSACPFKMMILLIVTISGRRR